MSSAPEIPLDLRERMRDCILSLFWPKKKIIEFLGSVDTPELLLPPADTEMTRKEIIVDVFGKLSARSDRGHTIFQTMMERLMNWSYLDPYYFEVLQKLDKGEAAKQIEQLKRAVERRNSSTEKRRTTYENTQRQRSSIADFNALKATFSKIFGTSMKPQERGIMFEVFLKQLFQRSGIEMGDPLRLTGEQIDGSFKFEGENYIVEAKWQEASVATSQLYTFAHKVDGKMYGRGVFISANSFSSEGIRAIVHGKMIQTILIDGEDLSHVLDGRISLRNMLDYKIRAAQTRGEVYVCGLRQQSKI